MKLSPEIIGPTKRFFRIAAVASLGFAEIGCDVEAYEEPKHPKATIIAINRVNDDLTPAQRAYYLVFDESAPELHNTTDNSILCIRKGDEDNTKPAQFQNGIKESRVIRECDAVQPILMLEKPVKGVDMIEGQTYVFVGPRQSVPLP